jgi:hypothetical protein
MAALTANRPTDRAGVQVIPNRVGNPIADNVHIFQGAIVQADGNGNMTPGGAATQADTHTFRTMGRAYKEYDNTVAGHAAGAFTVEPEFGAFLLDIAAGDAVAQTTTPSARRTPAAPSPSRANCSRSSPSPSSPAPRRSCGSAPASPDV